MEIRPFASDYSELRRLIQYAWALEHDGHIDFTEQYLQYLIESPDTDPYLTLGAYRNGTLISFLLSKKRRILVHGHEYKGLLHTLGSTHPDYAYLFPYIKLKDACVTKAAAQGYCLNFGFAAWGIKNNRIERLYAEKKGFQCTLVNSFGWLGWSPADGAVDRQKNETGDVRLHPPDPSDTDRIIKIMDQAAGRCPVFQKWDKSSFLSRLTQPTFFEGKAVSINGDVKGFIGLSIIDTVYKHLKRKICFLYHLFMDSLPGPVKQGVIRSLMEEMKAADVDGISVPNTGYFETGFLKQMGFKEIPFQKYKTNLYITLFKDRIAFGRNEPFYLEIV